MTGVKSASTAILKSIFDKAKCIRSKLPMVPKNAIKENTINSFYEGTEHKSLSEKAFDILAQGETSLEEIYSILINI